MNKAIVITGATSVFGLAMAQILSACLEYSGRRACK